MNTKQIEYVITIAEEKNMQRASEKLFVTQSALSQSLTKLEDELGCQLFQRLPREMIPTEAGRIYIENGKEILKIKSKTYAQIGSLNNPKSDFYKVGLSSHECIEKFLDVSSHLQKKYPGVEIFAVEDNFGNLINRLNKNEVSLLIVTWDSPDDLLLPHNVLKEEEIVLISKDKISERDCLSLENLKEQRFVLTPKGSSLRNITDNAFNRVNYSPHVICEINNIPATANIVQTQNAVAFLPYQLCSKYNLDNLRIYHLEPKLVRYQILVYTKNVKDDKKLQEFIKIIINSN